MLHALPGELLRDIPVEEELHEPPELKTLFSPSLAGKGCAKQSNTCLQRPLPVRQGMQVPGAPLPVEAGTPPSGLIHLRNPAQSKPGRKPKFLDSEVWLLPYWGPHLQICPSWPHLSRTLHPAHLPVLTP